MNLSDEPLFDPAVLTGVWVGGGLDRAFFADVVTTFCEDAVAHVESVKAALASGDPERLRRSAHGLKGSSVTVGAQRLSRLAASLELEALRISPERADARVREIERALDPTATALHAWVAGLPE